MLTHTPLVSVIIPTYNRADLLRDAIASVLAQDYPNVEVIVADDGSTDHTADVVASFGSRLTYLALPHRGLPAATRNAAIAAAAGEYIAFLDSDDLFLSHKLSLQVPVLEANPHIGVAYSDGYFFDSAPSRPIGHALAGLATPSGNVFGELLRANFLFMPLTLIRRALLENMGGFSEAPDLVVAEDYDLWLRLATEIKFHYVPGDVAAIRMHTGNISANKLRIHHCILGILHRLDTQFPVLMAEYAPQRHEGYARNHGGIAQAAMQQRQWGLAMRHASYALWHTIQLPGMGLGTVRAWWERRQLRAPAHTPSTHERGG